MTTFDEREKAFEDKFKHDQDLLFRIQVRRNKLLGLWVAELIGRSGDAAQAYAKEVIAADFEEPGVSDVIRKIRHDIDDAGVELSDHRLQKKMDELLEIARKQVMTE